MNILLVIALMIIAFAFGTVFGYLIGYQQGVNDISNYVIKAFDGLNLEKAHAELSSLNQTKLENFLRGLENLTNELNSRMNNITILP